jgi:hypothetical protein
LRLPDLSQFALLTTPSPGPLLFNTILGQQSAPQTAMIVNAGTIATSPITTMVQDPFSIASDACSGQMLAPGQSCTVSVIFTPTVVDETYGGLFVSATRGGTLQILQVGYGVQVSWNPSSYDFQAMVGTASPNQNFVLTNVSSVPTRTLGIGIEFRPQDFLVTDGCGARPLAAGASCTVGVVFQPSFKGDLPVQLCPWYEMPMSGYHAPCVGILATGL